MTTTTRPARTTRPVELPPGAVAPVVLEVHQYARTATIVDVREREELVETGWVAGALHVPPAIFELWADPSGPLHRTPPDPRRPVVVYCDSGTRSMRAAARLRELGHHDVAHLDGGLEAWIRADLPVAGLKPWHPGPTSLAPAGDDADRRGA